MHLSESPHHRCSPRLHWPGPTPPQGEIGFVCYTCEADSTQVMCPACYEQSNHVGHEVHFLRFNGGTCDCGNLESWDVAGCCPRHRGTFPARVCNCPGGTGGARQCSRHAPGCSLMSLMTLDRKWHCRFGSVFVEVMMMMMMMMMMVVVVVVIVMLVP